MEIKIPKNGFILLTVKDSKIDSLRIIEEHDLYQKAQRKAMLNIALKNTQPECLKCERIVEHCAGQFKEDSFSCNHFKYDKDAMERIKQFYLNGSI